MKINKKNFKKNFIFIAVLVTVGTVLIFFIGNIFKLRIYKHDTIAYNTKERFINAMSENEHINYQQALEKHEKKILEILRSNSTIKYETLTKTRVISEGNNEQLKANFIIEVAYIYDKKNNTYKVLDAFVSEAFIKDAIYSSFDSGYYNYEKAEDSIRISVTGRFCFIPKHYISTNKNIIKENFKYYTNILTWIINI